MCASAHAAVGSTQVGSSVDTNAPGRAQDYRVSANASGRIDRLSVFLDRSSTAKVVGIGLYASSGSATAGALLARCGVYKTVPGAWNRCSIPAVTVTAGQTYWLSILQPTGTSGTIAFRNDPASGRTFGSYSSTLSTLADTNPWRNGPDWGAQTASVYGDQASAEPAPSPSPTPTPTPSPSATPTPSPSATPTPTPTPSPSPAGTCAVSTPNVADGRDPWGGCWPGPSNTGVPAGTVLTDYTGPCTITAANTVIDSKNVDCYLEIHAPGVVIRNSYITGHVWIDDPSTNASFTISDSTIDAGPVDTGGAYNDGNSAIGKSHFTATRVETFRGIRGIWCEFDCTVRDSWVHGQDKDEGGAAHESGIRMGSDSDPAHGQLIQHNSIRCDPPDVPPDGGCSADLTGYGDFAPIQNNTIDRNLFLATTGGACAYGGSSGANGVKPYGADANHDVFTNNVFQHRSEFQASGNCGYWFAIEDFDASRPGNQWVNNTWDTGGAVSP